MKTRILRALVSAAAATGLAVALVPGISSATPASAAPSLAATYRVFGTVTTGGVTRTFSYSGTASRAAATAKANTVIPANDCYPCAAGSENITWEVDYGSNYHFDNQVYWCWGGGVPGVHWGYDYNCSYTPGSNVFPHTFSYASAQTPFWDCSVHGANLYFFGWANMNFSRNTGFEDNDSATCTLDGVYQRHPFINWSVYANGYWSVSYES